MRYRLCWTAGALALSMLLPQTAVGQTCGNVKEGEELKSPPEIHAEGDMLSTTFDVQMKPFCIPSKKVSNDPADPWWQTQAMQLRTYVYPDPKNGQPAWGLPGPTLRVRKADEKGKGGQGIAILLKNSLPVSTEECASACPASIQCGPNQCEQANLAALVKACSSSAAPNNCCCVINCTQKAPNCFHGDNTTNLHFHGTHASPQEPQDFVLLELRPGKPPLNAEQEHGDHGPYSKIVYGEYQYELDPFRFTQSAGTHWYHPHKHGSVGLQVANGMAGALIIEGPFDDWLKQWKPNPLIPNSHVTERLMVIQQISLGTNLFQQGLPSQLLVNGQLSPVIKVAPGVVQRWRIVNATMSSQAMLEIKFDPRLVLKQIAMDGILFSETNFDCQPLANFDPKNPAFPCDPSAKLEKLTLAPGNRADFLVVMPYQETSKSQPPLRIERRMIDLPGEGGTQRMLLRQRDEELAPGIPDPALFKVVVDDGIDGNEDQPKLPAATASALPSRLPALSDEMKSVRGAEVIDPHPVTMTFQQVEAVTGQPWPYTGSPLSQFKIDGKQFDGSCVNVTTVLNTSRTWTVSNATRLPHPFHIHTNPFALLNYGGASLKPGGRPEPIWMDTMPLPLAKLVPCADPKNCPTAIPCKIGKPELCTLQESSMTFEQRYEEFTGEYVLHCHFLGHEDRGMMFAVQTVCQNNQSFFGLAGVAVSECNGKLLPKVKPCP